MILITDYLIYDLVSNFPDYTILPFPVKGNPQNFVLVMPPTGKPSRYYTNGLLNASLIIQNVDNRTAIEQATDIFDHYRDQVNYTMTLPAAYMPDEKRTLTLTYIEPVDRPVPLGDVGNGRYQYSLNLMMTIGEL